MGYRLCLDRGARCSTRLRCNHECSNKRIASQPIVALHLIFAGSHAACCTCPPRLLKPEPSHPSLHFHHYCLSWGSATNTPCIGSTISFLRYYTPTLTFKTLWHLGAGKKDLYMTPEVSSVLRSRAQLRQYRVEEHRSYTFSGSC